MVLVRSDTLKNFANHALEISGLSSSDAEAIAASLIEADLRGVETHGVFRLPQYIRALRERKVNPSPNIIIAHRKGVTAICDADGGFGYSPSIIASDLAAEIAAESGVGVVAVRHSHHFGVAALYVERIAKRAQIGLITTNTTPAMAPPQGTVPVLGNNPIAIGVPLLERGDPIILDMALTRSAMGKVRVAAQRNLPIPESWGYDSNGIPTKDPNEVLKSRLLAPMGGYKGFGLAFMAEVLSGVLTGSPYGVNARSHDNVRGGIGHLVIAIDVGFFLDVDEFANRVLDLCQQLANNTSADVYLPGQKEYRLRNERLQTGIPLSNELVESLRSLTSYLEMASPDWLKTH